MPANSSGSQFLLPTAALATLLTHTSSSTPSRLRSFFERFKTSMGLSRGNCVSHAA
jgi:hypothetical protein